MALSFHETKNIISGEGGALLINQEAFIGAAEMIREKGTDRAKFYRGEVDKYSWRSLGSSYLPNEVTAAFLKAQLDIADIITQKRIDAWNAYYNFFEDAEKKGLLSRPIVPNHCGHNGHIFYVLLNKNLDRSSIIARLKERGVGAVSHYVPLHSSIAGVTYGKAFGSMNNTDCCAGRLLRLPMFADIELAEQQYVVHQLVDAIEMIS